MAITKTIEIDVNSQGATSGINNITNSIEGADKATQSLKSQLRQAQADVGELSDKFGATSKEAIEAAKRAGELKDAIGDAKSLTDAFNPDAKFSALSGSLSGVASGFAAVEGSLALAGVESENLQETMVRLQAAMALSQGLQGLGESIDSFKQMGAVAKNALSGIRTGIAATGIGVLLIALGAVVAYWDDIKSAVNGVSSEQEALNIKSQANLDSEQKKLDTIGSQDNVLKLQGKSERDILKIKIAQTDQVIKASEIQIENTIATTKAQTEAAKRNKSILQDLMRFAIEIAILPIRAILAPLDLIILTANKVAETLGFEKITDLNIQNEISKLTKLGSNKVSSFVFDPKETQAEGDKVIAEQKKALEKLKNDRAGMQLSIKAIDTQGAKDSQAKAKETADKEIELAKQKADALERIRQGEIDTQAERRAEELRQVQEQYKLLIADAEKFGQDTTALKEAQRTKEKELTDKFAAEDAEKKLAEDEKAKADAQKKLDEEKVIADKKIEIEKTIADAKLALQNQALDTASAGVGLIKGLFEKNKAIQKAALIAESAIGISKIIINTQAANAVASASPINAIDPTYGIRSRIINTVSAGIGIAANIAATAKGLAALGGGGAASGGNAGSAGGGSAPAPQFNVVGNTGVNQLAETLGSQQPVQAFVVANQVTSQQSLDRNIINNASLG